MTTDDSEVYFPRGALTSDLGGSSKGFPFKKLKTRKYLFEKKKPVKVPQKKLRKRVRDKLKALQESEEVGFEEDEDSGDDLLDYVEPLTYQSLTPGTLILATVNSVFNDFIKMDLPDRLSSRVNLKDMPSSLNQQSRVKLKKLFKPGESYTSKVVQVIREPNGFKVDLSLDPCSVNGDFRHDQFKEGTVFVGAVLSEEDHGFRIESGVKGLTCFLPKKYVTSKQKLETGKLVWCCVKKSKNLENTNRIEVTADLNEVSSSKLVEIESTDQLYPGAQFDVIAVKTKKQTVLVKSEDSLVQGYIQYGLSSELPKEGSRLTCTVLYKSPLVEFAAFTTKIKPDSVSCQDIEQGAVFERAEVVGHTKKGMIVCIKRKGRSYTGFITMRRLQNERESAQFADFVEQFPVGNHIKVRVIGFNYNDQLYSCTIESRLLNEKFISTNDLKVGQLVQFTVDELKTNGFSATVGAVRGFLPKNQITEVPVKNPESKIKLKSRLKGRILKIDHEMHSVVLTLRPSLVGHEPLTEFSKVKKGDVYYGSVVAVEDGGIRLGFFNNLSAYIKQTDLIMRPDKYTVGELLKCYVMTTSKIGSPRMSLSKPVDQMDLSIGESYTVIVKEVREKEIVCLLDENNFKGSGLIPILHLSDHPTVNTLLSSNYSVGVVLPNAILVDYQQGTPVFSLRQSVVDFVKAHKNLMEKGSRALSLNDYVPCSVSELDDKQVLLTCPVPMLNKKIRINRDILEKSGDEIEVYFPVMTVVSRIGPEFNLECHADDPKIWKNWAVSNLRNYLQILSKYQSIQIGSRVTVKVKKSKKGGLRLKLDSGRKVKLAGSSLPSQNFPAIVLFDDILDDRMVHVVHADEWERRAKKTKLFLYQNDYVLIGKNGATGKIIVVPRRIVPNDAELNLSMNEVNSRKHLIAEEISFERGYSLCYVTSENIQSELSVKDAVEPKIKPHSIDPPSKKAKKRKSEETTASDSPSGAAQLIKKRKLDAIKSFSLDDVGGFDLEATPADLTRAVASIGTDSTEMDLREDSDDEPVKVKKKLTPSEKKHLALEEEKKLRMKEEELLKAEENPQSAEHFDRLLLGQPNSSKLWIQYMAFYLQSAEIDRARAVAQRAIKLINSRFDKEKLNVWLALLNLDYSYSLPEVFKKTFSEALQHNDDYTVNMRVLELYTDSNKAAEIDQLTNSLVRKYKTKLDCWLKCQSSLMVVNLYDKARSFLQRSLAALPAKEHVTLISRFALMENKYGFSEEAQSLFENILTNYPLRIDLWFVYVDMLVKSNSIELARNVLERASSNRLPIRKLRAIYKKWLEFEKSHGSQETVDRVSEAAKVYLSDLLGQPVEHEEDTTKKVMKYETDREFVEEETESEMSDESELSDDDD